MIVTHFTKNRPKKIQLEGSAKIARSEYNALLAVGLDIMAAPAAKKAAAAALPTAPLADDAA